MRNQYDFSQAVKNPHANKTKTAITIRLDQANVDYFKQLAAKLNIPYQTLINSYLSDCVAKQLTPKTIWS